jgi:hypothetical protein
MYFLIHVYILRSNDELMTVKFSLVMDGCPAQPSRKRVDGGGAAAQKMP